MIKAIFFDQGGVLVKEAGIEQISLLSEVSGYSFEQCKIIRKKYWKKLKLGLIDDEEYWHGTTKYNNLNKGMFRELNIPKEKQKFIRDKSIACIKILDFSKKLLNQLSKKYVLGIISNNSKDWGENILKINGLDKYFKIIIFSHNVGLAKPNTKIYNLAFSKLNNTSPEEIVFIDDKEKSLIPARALGWNAILFTSYDELIQELNAFSIEIT